MVEQDKLINVLKTWKPFLEKELAKIQADYYIPDGERYDDGGLFEAGNAIQELISSIDAIEVQNFKFPIGSSVCKTGGDYPFEGTVVSTFYKLSKQPRYVIEDYRGCVMVLSEDILTLNDSQT